MRHLPKSFVALLVPCLLLACSDDEDVDNTPPTANEVTLNGKAEAIRANAGSTLLLKAVLEDNISLGQYKIDIHNNFDGHSHGRIKAPFSFSQAYTLTGNSETVQQELEIPNGSTPGEYHFQLQYFDAAGNEGDIVVLSFEIADPANQPTLTITSPDMSGEIEVAPGEDITVAGTAEDPDGLAEVHISVKKEEAHDHGRLKEGGSLAFFELEIPLNGETTWPINEMIAVPSEIPPGHYELIIMAEDMAGYQKTVAAELHVE